MAHNPYGPPTAEVADLGGVPPPPRPWQMKAAIAFMWISLALESITDLLDPTTFMPGAGDAPPILVVVVIYLVILALIVALVVCVGRGQRWARIVFTVVVLLSVLDEIQSVSASLAQPWPARIAYLLGIAIDSATLVLLFIPATNAWFRARAAARSAG